MRLAFIDSGLGLLPAFRHVIKKSLAHECFFFMCEEGPLGNKTDRELQKLAAKYVARFAQLKIDKAFVCCNTLSRFFPDSPDIYKVVTYNRKLLNGDSLVLATVATCRSKEYPRALALPSLAAEIESGDIEAIINTVGTIGLTDKRVILGCTHYPLIYRIFEDYYPNVEFLDGMKDMLKILETFKPDVRSYFANGKALPILSHFCPDIVLLPLS